MDVHAFPADGGPARFDTIRPHAARRFSPDMAPALIAVFAVVAAATAVALWLGA